MTLCYTVENGIEAEQKVTGLQNNGYSKDQIYLFAYSPRRAENLTGALETEEIGLLDDPMFFIGVKKLFSSREENLRNEMKAVGLDEKEAQMQEKKLEEGKILIVVDE